jgi:hypothetical protein
VVTVLGKDSGHSLGKDSGNFFSKSSGTTETTHFLSVGLARVGWG